MKKGLSKFACEFVLISLMCLSSACSPQSYGLASVSQSFGQSAAVVSNKVDILWVVDNSASMTTLQNNLVQNFSAFISDFMTKGYDFQMAVTSTDAYLSSVYFDNNPKLSVFRDGGTTHSGISVITPQTPNVISTFVTNASLGQTGSGDERAFSSIRATLNNSLNAGFLRQDAYLAIIILSDEDDFSGDGRAEGGGTDHDYTASTLDSVDSYISYLDSMTGSTSSQRRYGVSAIAVLDNTCLAAHRADSSSTIVGQRYIEIANKTDGVLGSICDSSYASSLTVIKNKIIELSTRFPLDRSANSSTIQVVVNGVTVPQSTSNGWSYDSSSNSILFHGTATPAQGSRITVNYTPDGAK
jgi:hypothetical protein